VHARIPSRLIIARSASLPRKSPAKPLATRKGTLPVVPHEVLPQAQDSQVVPVPPTAVILRLVHDAAAARVRLRAILNALERKGAISYEDYVREYVDLVERDAAGLVSRLILKKTDFDAAFGEWWKEDQERYGVGPDGGPKNAAKPRSRRKRRITSIGKPE
jgi:hypothetical protein